MLVRREGAVDEDKRWQRASESDDRFSPFRRRQPIVVGLVTALIALISLAIFLSIAGLDIGQFLIATLVSITVMTLAGCCFPSSETLKFSKKRLAVAFAVVGVSDAIGAFATPLPPIVWAVDFGTALLLFMVLGRQWLLVAWTGSEGDSGVGGASILAAGGCGDRCPWHSSAEA